MTSREALEILKAIKEGHMPRSAKPESLRGLSFAGEDLSGFDLSGIDLSNTNFSNANLRHAQLYNCNMRGAMLTGANLRRANLTGADLTEANMDGVKAVRAGFGMACLERATCFQGHLELCSFSKARLHHADFKCADLKCSRFREADLTGADFTEANMQGTDLSLSIVRDCIFNNADLRDSRLRQISGYRKAHWLGTDMRNINFAGAYLMRRFVNDQNYLKEFREKNSLNAVMYYIWKATSDCGRSMSLWCVWIIAITLFFAWIYTTVGIDYGTHPTKLSAVYFSVVTFTTLGYGDIRPSTVGGQVAAMAEVIIGYMMLGGLLSILSNKMARRAD